MPVNLAPIETTDYEQALLQSRKKLLDHPLYQAVNSAKWLRLFMREHVFAVWDFMSLLKRLQQIVTCCNVPWLPVKDPLAARFINEIVLGEECDEDGLGGYTSHFELYLSAMEEIGADTGPVRKFVSILGATAKSSEQCSADPGPFQMSVSTIGEGNVVDLALNQVGILSSTRAFVRSTMELTIHGKPHEVAAAFFYGREDVIPEMFTRFIDSLPKEGVNVGRMDHYLRRHIELDSSDHGPLAARLVKSLCNNDRLREREANQAAIEAISQRILLWDGLLSAIQSAEASTSGQSLL